MRLLAVTQRRDIALNLARAIRVASWLGKHALNAQSRALAYAVKAEKISTALLHCEDFFNVALIERSDHHGALVLIRMLPDGTGAHCPFGTLSVEAQAHVRRQIMTMIEPSSARAEARNAHPDGLKRAA